MHLQLAIIAAVLNAILSLILPCALSKTNIPLLDKIRIAYEKRHESLLVSSIVVGLIVYAAAEIAPSIIKQKEELNLDQLFRNKFFN